MKLKEKISNAKEKTKKLIKEDPMITSVWYNFLDCDLDEMREVLKEDDGNKLTFDESTSKMRLQLGWTGDSTIFIYSKKITRKEHFVINDAIVNI